MDPDKRHKIEKTITALQDRWGSKAIGRLQADRVIPCVPTGFPALDEALALGGLPRGRISEISGIPSSGMATIALKIAANAQAQKGTVIYIDVEQSFDPDYAARCGLVLDQLVLVRPHDIPQALAILHDFILSEGATGEGIASDSFASERIAGLVFDAPFKALIESQAAQSLVTALGRLIAPLSRTRCVLLFLTSLPANSSPTLADYPTNSALAHFATVRLFIQRERWVYRQQDIGGYQAQVLVVKNKLGPAGQRASISVMFDDDAL